MIFIRLSSGFGNQIFIYLFGKYLQDKFGSEISYEISSYKREKSQRTIELNIFQGFDSISSFKFSSFNIFPKLFSMLNKVNIIQEDEFKINQLRNLISDRNYFVGYWQNLEFLNDFPNFRNHLVIKESIPNYIKYVSDLIYNCTNSVAVHVRRGDYFSLYQNRFGVCDEKYFEKAISIINKNIDNPTFFIFSDDIDWVKSNLQFIKNKNVAYFVENKRINSYWYIFLMSICKNKIISNSTFSWWSAHLNENNNGIIVAPKIWRFDDPNFNLNRPTWLTI